MDARSLVEQLARFQLDVLPVARAEAGVTVIVDLGFGWFLGELDEDPVILHPDGSRSVVELRPPPVDAWVPLVRRWLTDYDRPGMPPEVRPHKALVRAMAVTLGSWTCTTMRDVWVEHSCGHGDWYVETENSKPRLEAYRRHECGDCSHPHDSFWDD